MKKLRPSIDEKIKFIEDLTEQLAWFNRDSFEDFSIEDLKKEYTKIDPKTVNKPTLQIAAETYLKMLELVNQSPVECMWHGLVKRYEAINTYLIYDILVFPQINSTTATTTDDNEFAKWQLELIKDPNFPIEDLRMHGHSHVNMNVFSSGIDDKYQKDLITKVDDGDYYIFLIMNKKMEMCAFIYDFSQQVMFDTKDITIQIMNAGSEDIRTWAKDQLKKYATTERYYLNKPQNKKEEKKVTSYFEEEKSLFSKAIPVFKGAYYGSK